MTEKDNSPDVDKEELLDTRGEISKLLIDQGLNNESLGEDHIGIELISVEPDKLYETIKKLKIIGFNYLQCQGGYDEGPGKRLVSFYHLITLNDIEKDFKVKEVRVKVFLERNSDLSIPSLFALFKGSDWQERETYDMFGIKFDGHPCPKRLLMPEDWRGWPLRKDYIQPDFYEMQDAY